MLQGRWGARAGCSLGEEADEQGVRIGHVGEVLGQGHALIYHVLYGSARKSMREVALCIG